MIAVDTSALIAILQDEDEAAHFMAIIAASSTRLMSATTVLEASLVIAGRGGTAALAELDQFVDRTPLEVVPFDYRLAVIARDAFLRYGKGRHPAALNFGDCASYALAKSRDVPLLFKGDDFSRTDVRAAA